MTLDEVKNYRKLYSYYQKMAEKAIGQLSDQEFFWQPNNESNSVAIIVNHIQGNLRSRWTDFLTSDGEKPWRDRDTEFETPEMDKNTLMKKWSNSWDLLFQTIDKLDESSIEQSIYIRNQAHSVSEALSRQLAHYASHVGQIVFLAKMIRQDSWQTLSIAKGQSKQFNLEKFGKGKHKGHFSDPS